MTQEFVAKLPRLYVSETLRAGESVEMSSETAHYLRNVMRRKQGERLRLFNGRDGEWLVRLASLDKKGATVDVQEQIRGQPDAKAEIHLLFAPIKKNRMDWLIEKSVELGVTDFHPVITQNTEVRQINEERVGRQIIEAAEQCERLVVPELHDACKLNDLLVTWHKDTVLFACVERVEAVSLSEALKSQKYEQPIFFLIGPEGGFTEEEKGRMSGAGFVKFVSLGETILRSETAALFVLARIKNL